MADLSGQTIASSYEQLLSLPDGGGNANTLVAVTDGDGGTTFGIKLATNKVEIIPGSNDTNAFEVSQADGTAVLTVDSTNALVGISASASSYHSDFNNLVVYENGNAGISIIGSTSGESSLGFGDGTSADTYRGAVAYVHTSGDNQDKMFFKTSSLNRMVIDSSGAVGIGTTSPNELLHVEGSSPSIRVKASNDGGLAEIKLESDRGDNNEDLWSLRADPAHEFKIMSNSTGNFSSHAVFRLTETEFAKDVGIGAAPTANLDVRGDSSKPIVNFGDADARDSDSTNLTGPGSFRYQFQNGSTSRPAIIEGGGDIATNESAVYFSGFASSQEVGHKNLGGMFVFRRNTGSTGGNRDGSELLFHTKKNDVAAPQANMTIFSDGNVGIGQHSSGNAVGASANQLKIYDDSAGSYATLIQQAQGDGLCLDLFASASDDHSNDAILRARTDASTLFEIFNDGNIHISGDDKKISFNTSGASGHPAISMDSNAAFSFLNTSGGTSVTIANDGSVSTTGQITVGSDVINNGNMYSNGTTGTHFLGLSNKRWHTVFGVNSDFSSDATLKKNIKTSDLGIDFINTLNPVKFNWKKSFQDDTKNHYGFLAQEIKETKLADSVNGEEGEMGMNYNELIAPMVKAIQELSSKVTELENKLGD